MSDNQNRVEFTREMKKDYTILTPNMAPIHFELVKNVLESFGFHVELLRTTGRAPSDYLRMFGPAPVLINMGVNGLIAMGVILLTGGDLNGPTVGGVLTIVGFSAFGKHAGNIVPIMAGVVLGSFVMHSSVSSGAVQLAMLFGTTLAPISGYFGWP